MICLLKEKRIRMNKNNILLLFFFILSSTVHAQVSEFIRTGRPGQSFGAFTVGKNIFQLQAGLTYWNAEIDAGDQSGLEETFIIRYGILENIELSALVVHTSESLNEKNVMSGVSRFDAGFRVHLFQRPSGFAGSFQTRIMTNALSEDFQRDNLGVNSAVSLLYPALGGGFTFNGGLRLPGDGQGARYFYTFNYSYNITDDLSVFIEPYGTFFREWNQYIDAGVGILITKDLLIDISAGIDLNYEEDYFFVDGGFSYRFLGLR